jgi:nucleotide-binding universal stress UspA family protein
MSPAAAISRILVAVDFDDASVSALEMAGVLASAWRAELTVFHAATTDAPAYFTAAQMGALEAEREQSWKDIAERLRAMADRQTTSAARVIVEEGPPAAALLRTAAAFDLIVVGTHRRRGARRWWLGSVAEEIVHRSPRPVLVVPAGGVVPDVAQPLSIRAATGSAAEVDWWVDVFGRTFNASVVGSLDLRQCAPDSLRDTDLIVLPAAAGRDAGARSGAIGQVLEQCVHPVLFVPPADGNSERSTS